MFAFVLISTTLFSMMSAACSDNDNTAESVCASADCAWVPGSCTEMDFSDCSLGNCIGGCVYVPYQDGSCSDSTVSSCKSTSDDSCSDSCQLITGGYCEESSNAADIPNCNGEFETWEGCPSGCEWDRIVTECFAPSTGESSYGWCGMYSTTGPSECSDSYICKVSGTSCVANTESGICWDCANYQYIGGRDVFLSCTTDDICSVCQEVTVNGSKMCQFSAAAANTYCANLSTVPELSPCVQNSAYCKVASYESNESSNGSSGTYCASRTFDEICGLKSTVKDKSECSMFEGGSFCTADEDGDCVMKEWPPENGTGGDDEEELPYYKRTFSNQYYDECSSKSTKLSSSCLLSVSPKCMVDSSGKCGTWKPSCRAAADKSGCDGSSDSECNTHQKVQCKKMSCVTGSRDQCENTKGCVWNEGSTCVTNTPCGTNSDKTCPIANDSCVTTSSISEDCYTPIPLSSCTVETNSASCVAATGCKWQPNGGKCINKTCATDPNFARCCSSDGTNCAFCKGIPTPVGCPACSSSYAECCLLANDQSCTYCQGTPKPDDCPITTTTKTCASDPSFDLCCPTGLPCNSYCTTGSTDPKCTPSSPSSAVSMASLGSTLISLLLFLFFFYN